MKAIRTRYSGPTNTRGSRIHATDADGNRISISYPCELNSDEAHELAAYTLSLDFFHLLEDSRLFHFKPKGIEEPQ